MKRFLGFLFPLIWMLWPAGCGKSPSPVSPSGSSLSSDGTEWIFSTVNATSSGRYGHTSVVFNDKLWMLGGNSSLGYLNDTWFSSDGALWSQAAANGSGSSFSAREFHASAVFNGQMWTLGGYGNSGAMNDTWSSLDGLHWAQANNGASNSFTARCNNPALSFNSKMWVLGGDTDPSGGTSDLNDVWSSSDGVTWTQVAANGSPNSFPARDSHTALVFNNQMWVLGGVLGATQATTFLNDVWSSGDGATWTQVAANGSASSFPARGFHASVVFDGAMWVLGGLNAGGYLNDAWYSADGSHWSQALIQQDFVPRFGHTALAFNNAMWILSGFGGGTYLNDAWHSP